jgi:uncharacterized MnhB-related membrane protein
MLVLLLLGMIAFSVAAVVSKDLLVASVFLSMVSFMLALSFLMLQAPDIAITEAAVKAGLVGIIFVVAIMKTRRMEK